MTRTLNLAPPLFPALRAESPDIVFCQPYMVDISFVDDDEMRDLNRSYRGKDRPTDVLSFSLVEGAASDDDALPFPTMDDEFFPLGDLIIALPTALRQARERHHSIETEVAFLSIHGTLHLLGYDHDTSARRRAMWKWQEEVSR